MEARVHAHILYVGDNTDSKEAREELERLSKKSDDCECIVVDVNKVGIQKMSPPVLFADEGEFDTMKDIKWFVRQHLQKSKA